MWKHSVRSKPGLAFAAAVALGLGLSLALSLVPAEPALAQSGSFTEATEVLVVEVPVNIVADGAPVRGLTKEDFELFDGRKKQDILSLDVIDLATLDRAAAADEPVTIPSAARRHFLLLFDLSFSEPARIVRARSAAKELVNESLHAEDLAAVATYTINQGPRLILGFTSDRDQLDLAIDTLGAPTLVSRAVDPLGITFGQPIDRGTASLQQSGGNDQFGVGAAQEEAVQDYLETISGAARGFERQVQAAPVEALTKQLGALAGLLGSVEGRKHVVYLSEGFDSQVLTGNSGLGGDRSDQQAIESGQSYNVNSDAMFGSGAVQNDLQDMLQVFREANCVIQAVDIGGARAPGGANASGQEGLLTMAKDTGGEFFSNYNDLGAAMDEILERTSVTYLLTFQPKDLKFDGKYRRLRVKVNHLPRGAEIYARPGYVQPDKDAEVSGFERRLRTADALMGTEGGSIDTSILATPFQVSGETPYTPVLIEIGGPSLIAGSRGDALPLEIYVYAMDEQGGVRDFFTQAMTLDLGQSAEALRQGGIKYYGHLDLDPGRYTLRALVRNGATGSSTLRVVNLRVPDFGGGAPTLQPPLFPENPGRWVMLREEAERQREVPYPFMMKEQPFIPAALPVFGPKVSAQAVLVAHRLEGKKVEVSGRLVGADGAKAEDLKIRLADRVATGAPNEEVLILEIQAKGLRPGRYDLELTVSDAQGWSSSTTASVAVDAKGGGGLLGS